jgi:acetylglutamate kinase
MYCFEKKGVLENVDDDKSVIGVIDAVNYPRLKREGKLFAGMLPKIDNAFAAIAAGVKEVLIGHADDLLANTGDHIQGTVIR